MKIIKRLAVISTLALSFNSLAACKYPDKLTNTIITPALITAAAWHADFVITNISDYPVTVNLELTNQNAGVYTPLSPSFMANFSSINNPFDLVNGGVLQPGELGQVRISDPAALGSRINVGQIRWTSSKCIPHALMVTVGNQFNHGNRFSENTFVMNGGKPF